MKNKDKYELSGRDENLSERKSRIRKTYEESKIIETPEQKQERVDEQAKKVDYKNSNFVIPEEVKNADEKPKVTVSQNKQTQQEVDYNKYNESLGKIDYNNYDTKETIENGNNKSGLNAVVLICIIVLFAIIAVMTIFIVDTTESISEEFVKYNNSYTGGTTHTFGGEICEYKNIVVELKEDYLGKWTIFATNKGNMDYGSTELLIIFYDENKEIIDIAIEHFSILPVNHTVSSISYDDIPEYDSFEIFYDKEETELYTSFGLDYTVDGVEFVNVEESYNITFEVKNVLAEKIDTVSFTSLLYMGDELVYSEEGYVSDLRSGKTKEESIYLDSEIEYDRIEFMINSVRLAD